MKIKVEVTLDVDAEAWRNEYGLGDVSEVRADVKEYFFHTCHAQLEQLGLQSA